MSAARRRRVLVLAEALVLAAAGCAPQGESLVGRYAHHVDARDNPPWSETVGDFEMQFDPDGRFYARRVGQWQVEGRYKVERDLLLMDDYGGTGPCRDSGVDLASALYRIHRVADGIAFEALRDECRGRRESLPLKPWYRVR